MADKQPQAHAVKDGAELDRPIGLVGGTAFVIGGVIGMGIYALIAQVTAQVGPTLWLAFAIAMLISIIGVIPLIQISSALPRAGGGYLYTSRLLNPLLGVLASWWAILGVVCTISFVSLGLAGYIAAYLPWKIPISLLAILLPVLFLALYFFGLKIAISMQVILTAVLILALLVYGVKGASAGGIRFTLSLPQGAGGLIMASILCYSVCMGFQVIAEMGEEMKNARKNIPLSLLIGGAVILVVYILVGTVFANLVPYDLESIKAMSAPLKETGERFLSPFWVSALSIGALAAGLTSFNAGAIAIPRELFSQARDGIMPSFIGHISKKTKTPLNAVVLFFGLVILLLIIDAFLGLGIDFFGVMTAIGVLLMTVLVSIAALHLPKKFPEEYEKAYFKLPRGVLKIVAVISVISCGGFVALVLMELPVTGILYAVFTFLLVVFYYLRVAAIKKRGIDWDEQIRHMPGSDEV